MYRPYFCVAVVLSLAGCAAIDSEGLFQAPADVDKTDPFKNERQALFDQPFIDPLTSYLIEHQGDSERESTLRKIRQERDLRCQNIARQYSDEPATQTVLNRYNRGYGYSCPKQVAEFKTKVDQQRSQHQAAPEPSLPAPSEPPPPSPPLLPPEPESQVADQALGDCYLLTSIRNYSAAREACREPADKGDVRSQANMARISHAFEEFDEAAEWAKKAAPASADAAFLLGQMYASGQGVSQNTGQSVYWFKEAAKQGSKEAQSVLNQRD